MEKSNLNKMVSAQRAKEEPAQDICPACCTRGCENSLDKITSILGFPAGSAVKNLPANAGHAGDVSSAPGLRSYPGEGNGNLLQHSYMENPTDRGGWWAPVPGVTRVRHNLATEHTPTHTCPHYYM